MTGIIGTFAELVAPEKENKYAETILALDAATKENPATSWVVDVDASRESAEKLEISKAANAINRTASFKNADYSGRTQVGTREKSGKPIYSGTIRFTVVLVEKHKARKGAEAEAAKAAEAEANGKNSK